MAKARVELECSYCGDTYTVEKDCLNRKEADSWEEYMKGQTGLCPFCLAEQRRKESEKAEAEAREKGLPELTGSEKQTAWAVKIRKELLDKIAERVQKYDDDKAKAIMNRIMSIRSASYWIDRRDNPGIIINEAKEKIAADAEAAPQPVQKDAEAEATVAPENRQSDIIAKIDVVGDTIRIINDKDETLREIYKDNGYTWVDGAWTRNISKWSEPVEDRVAEIGNKILAAGYAVRIWDEELRRRAVAGEYKPEQTRWITRYSNGDYEGRLCIRWRGKDEEIYNAARKIKGSKYNNGEVVVDPCYGDQIEDFAQLYSFSLSPGAREAIDDYRAALNNPVEVKQPNHPEPESAKEKLNKILKSSDEVIEDLKDDD